MERRFDCSSGQVAEIAHTPVAVPVLKISRHQFRRAVSALNGAKRTAFESWLTTTTEANKDYFLDARWLDRNSPQIEAARVAMNVGQGAVDTLFVNALQYPE